MSSDSLFNVIIGIIISSYLLDKFIDYLNFKSFDKKIPSKLEDVYNEEEYKKAQEYKKANAKFSFFSSIFSILITLSFFIFDGFRIVDDFARTYFENPILVGLVFFGVIIFGLELLSFPLSIYKTFVIEEKFGFNKTSIKTFILDKIKGWLLTIIVGGGILALIIWFYQFTREYFWIYAWGFLAAFSILTNMFYAKLIVPLFNKQKPLEEGDLKLAIEGYAQKVGFTLDNIYVIDGSKRSTKANAYFSGFGSQKRITLYDTLINNLETDEIVAVLAHEVGHYKKKHILFNIFTSIILTGITFYILSLFIDSPTLSFALGVSEPSFHIGLIAFGVLYSPISEITGIIMNFISRKFEYQADNYAKETFSSEPLISSLKKLSKNSLSNLTPHTTYVFVHYSHPTLLDRVKNLEI